MRRAAFIGGVAAWGWCAGTARATGGRDVGNEITTADMRVLLASGVARAPFAETIDAYQFRWNGRVYRGRPESAVLPDGRVGLIDVVPLDAYLYGVITKEVSAGWPRAALQSQAIVARTYVLLRRRPGKPYDVVAGDADQAYVGIEGETVEGRDAVDATAGTVVTFGSTPARVAYSACCGGHTATAGELWGTDFPYLRGVVDPHCTIAPEFHWQREVPVDEFVRALGSAAANTGALVRVELRDVDETGRPREVALVGGRATAEVKLAAFRNGLGTSVVRSTLVQSVVLERGSVAISGTGHGHGVGLCQWGARAMAQQGASSNDIVAFYFPGTALGRA